MLALWWYSLILPPFPFLFLAVVGFALLGKKPRLGKACVWAGAAGLYLASLPVVSTGLLRSLEAAPLDASDPVAVAAELEGVGCIVVLGADLERRAPEYGGPTLGRLSLERLRYGARLAKEHGLPTLVSGGLLRGGREPLAAMMANCLRDEFGLGEVWIEPSSRNTWGNAVFSAEVLASKGVGRVVLVTHAWHMPRAARAFAAQGLDVVPGPTGYRPVEKLAFEDFVPSAKALWLTSLACHEMLGGLYYRLRYSAE